MQIHIHVEPNRMHRSIQNTNHLYLQTVSHDVWYSQTDISIQVLTYGVTFTSLISSYPLVEVLIHKPTNQLRPIAILRRLFGTIGKPSSSTCTSV